MPTSQTILTVMNLALDHVGEYPLTTQQDASPYARWLNRNFAHTVQTTLRQNYWNFACEFHQVMTEPDPPAFRWRYRYGLPPGWLRVVPLTRDGSRGGEMIAHEVKRNKLYTNWSPPLNVELVMDVQEPGEWDPIFAEVVAGRLALGMAHRFTAKTSYVDRAKQITDEAYTTAEQINAFEGSMEPIEQHDVIRVRGGLDTLRGLR